MLGDRAGVKVASAPGTGTTISLGAAVTSPTSGDWQTFAAAGVVDGVNVPYTIVDGHNWETNCGTLTASGPTLTRGTPSGSNNGGGRINASKNSVVFITVRAQELTPAIVGAVGDGVADDTNVINTGLSAGLPAIFAPKTHVISSSVYIREGNRIEGNGATLLMTAFDTFIRQVGDGVPLSSTVITSNPVAGTNTIAVTSVAGISVGDRVAFRLGDNAYDAFESPIYAGTAVVLAINTLTLTLDRMIPYNINVTGATNNKHVDRFASYIHDVNINNLFLDASASTVVDGGCILFWARNLDFDHIGVNARGGLNFGYGFFFEYTENVTFRSPVTYHNENTSAVSSLGRMFNFAACRDFYVYDAVCDDVHDNFAFVEDYCENINFLNPVIRHYSNPSGLCGV